MFRLLLLLFLFPVVGFSQNTAKRMLEHADIAKWKNIESSKISGDGRWVAYVVKPLEGDGELRLYDAQTEKTYPVPRAENLNFSQDSRYLAFIIKPHQDSTMNMRRRKVKKEDLPKDTLGVYDLRTLRLSKYGGVKSYQMPEKWSGWLAYLREPVKRPAKDTSGFVWKKESEENGTRLILLELEEKQERLIGYVKTYQLARDKARIAWYTTGGDPEQKPGVYVFDGETRQTKQVLAQKGNVKQLVFDRPGNQLAFVADVDTTKARIRPFGLYHWQNTADKAKLVLSPGASFLPKDWLPSENGTISFSKDGSKMFFGIAPPPILQDTTLLEEEIVNMEVWSTNDPRIYPMQKVQLDRDRKRSYTCILHTADGKLVQLGSPDVPEIRLSNEGNGNLALGLSNLPYQIQVSWDAEPINDVYLIDVSNGKKEKIATAVHGSPALSPVGKYVYWFNAIDTAWTAWNIAKKELVKLSNNQKVSFADELHDSPSSPNDYGFAGWTTEDDYFMAYDRYDIWLLDPTNQLKATNLTNMRAEKIEMRYIRTDPEERSIEEVKPLLLHFTNETTKDEGYYWYDIHSGKKRPLQQGAFMYSRQVQKAKNADRWIFTRENFQTFPDLVYSSDLQKIKTISQANPQQSEFYWGTVELTEWTALDGQRLQGLLIKPAGFDPKKKYPMITYFYERNSDLLHQHRTPAYNRTVLSFSQLASRGFLVFIPDIPYRIGYPGESAHNAVISGVTALVDKGFVDKDNLGVQGHSWGGYQIAYLVTQTNIFKCAESGAPVVNMVSAYGGIRWESGMSRMFQYEHTQSRIGGTLWEKPLRYLENSPIFFIDKVNTPLLIMHNDKDGAVPWYQGIEFYMALRRLGKPAWMLNYNEEGHGLVKYQNRKDFQLRMLQFFEHYLKGAPKPVWMEKGVPAIEKGVK
ncbi:alpha/beta hydrolase family protein [Haliscomenobacter hydrossis]|uniref:Peptidase S9 prolyl oligopeptidase active site domain protein n=1 Tax=Haliscomenobacter hydrossis (strain ATCC 27775 / DSM 1100 / LMG 10767 / O) TaxID=760192 RepID=F4L4J5_HALH1|nr:prolyl oligopeptidase family serine peptidase [Haliscomenobacter hydrossis]AEE51996.1 peptidase S9 prolyl oligopeptidase active site domain protein [Haliscomenobacter hydrossis DSM 1100]